MSLGNLSPLVKLGLKIIMGIIIYSVLGFWGLFIALIVIVCWQVYTDGGLWQNALGLVHKIMGDRMYKNSHQPEQKKEQQEEGGSAFAQLFNKK